ncbi:MAG: HAD hydrolase-like protein, partial [Pseudomonadota bacterium]
MQILDDEFELVLFDLDGTLVDTAPDMVAVLQAIQRDRGVEPVPYELGRSFVSHGAIGLLSVGFPELEITFGDDLHLEYLERYSDNVCTDSVVFEGVSQLLDALDNAACPWGVVTNKPEQLTNPLIAALGLADRIA